MSLTDDEKKILMDQARAAYMTQLQDLHKLRQEELAEVEERYETQVRTLATQLNETWQRLEAVV